MPISIRVEPSQAAIENFAQRKPMPTSLGSAGLSRLPLAMRDRAFFSARVNNARLLSEMQSKIGEALDFAKRDPQKAFMSRDRFVSDMKESLKERGYALGGTGLQDITSNKRLSLIYDMNLSNAHEYVRFVQGQDPDILNAFPAQEFLRIESRQEERQDWPQRWSAAGGQVFGGRMIALKGDPVWIGLSRFDKPFPPFDFGSGMGIRDIRRKEAEQLGLIESFEDIIPDDPNIYDMAMSAENIPEILREMVLGDSPNIILTAQNEFVFVSQDRFPTWKDYGFSSSANWRGTAISETFTKADAAHERLVKGEKVKTPIGSEVVFGKEILEHWADAEKIVADKNSRLRRLDVAQKGVESAIEVWDDGRQKKFLNIYENEKGKLKGVATVVLKNGNARTYFFPDTKKLDGLRKGKRVYAK